MQNDCRELMMIRNTQFSIAAVLALGALAYLAWVVYSIRRGRRRLDLKFSWSKILRILILVIILAGWWILWHTDVLLTQILNRYPCCGYAVTVRVVIPWPTAFVWISWGVTLWLLVLIAITFSPKVNKQISGEVG